MDNYTPIRDGLHTTVATVSALNLILDYEPDMVEVHPMAWILLDSFEDAGAPAGQIGTRFRFMTRVVAPIQNSKAAEDELIFVAFQVADAIRRNKQFSGAITKGIATASDGRVGWITVGGKRCRVVDVFTTAYVKYDQ